MGKELGAVGLMVGEPLSQALGQKLEQFVIILAGAVALPGGLGRHHFSQHLRTRALVGGSSRFKVRRSRLRSALSAPFPRLPEAPGLPSPAPMPACSSLPPLPLTRGACASAAGCG